MKEVYKGLVFLVAYHLVRTGKNEQTAAALPFRTQIWVDERVRTRDCYRNASNRQNECHGAQRSRPSPDEIHEDSSRIGCAERSPRRQTACDTRVSSDCYRGRSETVAPLSVM